MAGTICISSIRARIANPMTGPARREKKNLLRTIEQHLKKQQEPVSHSERKMAEFIETPVKQYDTKNPKHQ